MHIYTKVVEQVQAEEPEFEVVVEENEEEVFPKANPEAPTDTYVNPIPSKASPVDNL